MAYKTKRFSSPKAKKVSSSNEGKKRHSSSSASAGKLGSYAHKAIHAAGKAKRY